MEDQDIVLVHLMIQMAMMAIVDHIPMKSTKMVIDLMTLTIEDIVVVLEMVKIEMETNTKILTANKAIK